MKVKSGKKYWLSMWKSLGGLDELAKLAGYKKEVLNKQSKTK